MSNSPIDNNVMDTNITMPIPTKDSVAYDISRYSTKDTIEMLTFLLEKVIKGNDNLPPAHHHQQQQLPTNGERRKSLNNNNLFICFHARSIPSISIHAYLTRIFKYCPCANECFLALLVYFDRMSKTTNTRTQGLRIGSYNIHRLIISGLMISSKLFSDVFFTNTRYAKVGGLSVTELNALELEFLAINEFSLFVSLEELQHYGNQLLLHWRNEHEDVVADMEKEYIMSEPTSSRTSQEQEENFGEPVRRRARHLSIDKHGDEIDFSAAANHDNSDNGNRVHKKPTNCP